MIAAYDGSGDLRRATGSDCPGLSAMVLRSKASNGYDAAFMAACADELAVTPERLGRQEVWVIDGPGGPLACAALDPDGGEALGEVSLFFADPTAQGRGLGKRLWHHIVARARVLGLRRLALDADPVAEPFYASMGCRTVGRVPSGSIPGRTLPHMICDL